MARDTINTVGVIGLGRMGLPMARHIAAAGYQVIGAESDQARADLAARSGIEMAPNPAALAGRCEAILIAVGFDDEVEIAVFGPNGLAETARPGTVVMVASTVAPGFMADLARRCADRKLCAIDVPVARGETAAEAGKLLVFAGGEPDCVRHCRPLLERFAERIDYLGPAGAGQTAKAINNMLLWSCLVASVEGLDFGAALGLDREALREALNHSSGANWAMQTRADERPALWAEKDMDLLLAEARAAGFDMPVSRTVREAIAAFKKARSLPSPPRK